ncbi:MAG: DUF2889 domain-containing protein [Pseudomonadota bacterium]
MHHSEDQGKPEVPAVTRERLHTRAIVFEGFSRSDGLWDVEGSLLDTKRIAWERVNLPTYQPGDPVHHLKVLVTLDDYLTVIAISSDLPTTPHAECQKTGEPLQQLVGQRIGRGWRRAIESAMGGTAGCTHLRELLVGLGTGAIQAIGGVRDQRRRKQGLPPILPEGQSPHFVGGCLTWRRDGPVLQKYFPQFAIFPASDKESS